MLFGSTLPSPKAVSVIQAYALALNPPLTFNPPSLPKTAKVPKLVAKVNLESSFNAAPPSAVFAGSKFMP